MQPDDLWACIASLPVERRTLTVCSFSPLTEPSAPVAGWRRPVVGNHDTVARLRLAVAHQRAPYLLFVNADCRLRDPFAVDLALGHLSQGRAVVGALLAYGDQVAAAGYAFGTRGPYPRYAGWSLDNERVLRPCGLQAVPLSFLATKRVTWNAVGGLRVDFQDRPYADADYCVRSSHLGQGGVFYEPSIVVDSPLLPPNDGAAAQLLIASAAPTYDEWAVL